jgi:uroporphyrinogen decarboxylase
MEAVMTKRERVIGAIQHKDTDITPYHIDFTQQEHEKVAEYLGDDSFDKKIGNHISSAYYGGHLFELSPGSGYWKDDYGVVWNRNCADKDIGVIDGLVIKQPVPGCYALPTLDEKRLRGEYEQLMISGDDTFKIGAIGFSMFERAWTLRGMENFLMDMVLEPAFVDWLLDAITDYNLAIVDIALEYGMDGFYFGDDWGQQSGLIMGPRLWRRFIKPRMARMYEKVKSRGKFVAQHSCGDIHEIFPDLIDIGLDIYQTFQPEIYDMEKEKKEVGGNLTFWGGISTQRLLPFATPDEVKRVTKETIRILGANGGYIAAPTHSVPGDVPAENIAALIEVFQNQMVR